MARHIYLRTGPFIIDVETECPEVIAGIEQLYDPRCIIPPPPFCDFHVAVRQPLLRRLFRPQAIFVFEGLRPFIPAPRQHAAAILEWGMNWAISCFAHQYLILHAAVVERHGLALILPAPPGSGKSTLCTGLAFRGWRLLSDELALVRPETGEIVALARPISLKNESIEVIRRFAPQAVMGRPNEGSAKGTIVLTKPPTASIDFVDVTAMPRWIVFPKYQAGADLQFTPRSRASAFIELGDNAMNYNVLGEDGFEAMADLVTRCEAGDFVYSDLEEAAAFLSAMADRALEQDEPERIPARRP